MLNSNIISGCGAIAGDFLDAVIQHGIKSHKVCLIFASKFCLNASLHIVAAREQERAQQFHQKHKCGVAIAYGSYEELLADANVGKFQALKR